MEELERLAQRRRLLVVQGFARGEDPETLRQRMQEEQMAAGAGPVNRAQRRQMKRKGKGSVRSRGGGGGFS